MKRQCLLCSCAHFSILLFPMIAAISMSASVSSFALKIGNRHDRIDNRIVPTDQMSNATSFQNFVRLPAIRKFDWKTHPPSGPHTWVKLQGLWTLWFQPDWPWSVAYMKSRFAPLSAQLLITPCCLLTSRTLHHVLAIPPDHLDQQTFSAVQPQYSLLFEFGFSSAALARHGVYPSTLPYGYRRFQHRNLLSIATRDKQKTQILWRR